MSTVRYVMCLLRGHDWEGGLPSGHSFCRHCDRYDDHPWVLREEAVRSWMRRWSPIGIGLWHGDLRVRVGAYRWGVQLWCRVHYRWNREEELPGVHLGADIWRLQLHAGVGSAYMDEEGDSRQLAHCGASLRTYGLRYIGCWRGHRPEHHTGMLAGYVSCARCDTTLIDPYAYRGEVAP